MTRLANAPRVHRSAVEIAKAKIGTISNRVHRWRPGTLTRIHTRRLIKKVNRGDVEVLASYAATKRMVGQVLDALAAEGASKNARRHIITPGARFVIIEAVEQIVRSCVQKAVTVNKANSNNRMYLTGHAMNVAIHLSKNDVDSRIYSASNVTRDE
jgi:hypothetical protein